MSSNAFAQPCYRCNRTVEPGQGFFERDRRRLAGRAQQGSRRLWLCQHAACAIVFRGTLQMDSEETVAPWLLEELHKLNTNKKLKRWEVSNAAEKLRSRRIQQARQEAEA